MGGQTVNIHKCCEIQDRKIWTNTIQNLHKSLQRQLTFSSLGPVAEDYGDTLTDGLQLLYNLIHKLSKIYDDVYFLINHHKNKPFGSNPDLPQYDENGEEILPEPLDPSLTEEEREVIEAHLYEQAMEEY